MFDREMRLPIDATREEPRLGERPDYPTFVGKQGEIRGYKTELTEIWRPVYVTRRTSVMHAVGENQDHTKFVIWYCWRRRPLPGRWGWGGGGWL